MLFGLFLIGGWTVFQGIDGLVTFYLAEEFEASGSTIGWYGTLKGIGMVVGAVGVATIVRKLGHRTAAFITLAQSRRAAWSSRRLTRPLRSWPSRSCGASPLACSGQPTQRSRWTSPTIESPDQCSLFLESWQHWFGNRRVSRKVSRDTYDITTVFPIPGHRQPAPGATDHSSPQEIRRTRGPSR